MFLVMGCLVLCTGGLLPFLSLFTVLDYVYLVCSAIAAFAMQYLKQLAVQYDTASRVTMYNYLQSFVQLFFDVLVFKYVFHF